jgi:transcription initiation factor TFIIIB Brf1 subunit/transcription initiation factor TFIIB
MKNALDKTKVKKNIVEMVTDKLKKLEPTFQVLKKVLNIDVKKPDDTEISNYVNKVCKALTDTHKKTDQIRIDNLITASYVQVKRQIPG